MSELLIKDGASVNKYLATMGVGTTGAAFHNIPADFYTEVQKGNVVGHSIIEKFAHNDTVPNGSWEGVLQVAAQFVFLTAATKVRVKAGGNGADTAAGAGAQAVTVEGLDTNGDFVSESIELAGAAASALTTALFWRVFRAYVTPLRSGSYTAAVPTAAIVIENGTGGTDLITIIAGEGQTAYGSYSIPLGKTGHLISLRLSSESTKSSNFRLYTRASLTDVTTPFAPKLIKRHWDGVAGIEPIVTRASMLVMPALTDVWFDCYGAGAISQCSVDFEILLVDD